MISEQEMMALAHACRLSLTPEECIRYARDLEALEALAEVLPPNEKAGSWQRRACALGELREDRGFPSPLREEMLSNAPMQTDGYIVVPRTVEEV